MRYVTDAIVVLYALSVLHFLLLSLHPDAQKHLLNKNLTPLARDLIVTPCVMLWPMFIVARRRRR